MWKDIPGFEGYYQISEDGQVKGLKRIVTDSAGHTYIIKERILKPTNIGKGYLGVSLMKNGKRTTEYIHVLVAIAFVQKPMIHENVRLIVNHKDGNKHNNHYTNLEWVTYSYNNLHALDNGLRKGRGSEQYKAKLNENDVLYMKIQFNKGKEPKDMFEIFPYVSRTTIYDVYKNRTWKQVII